LFKAAAKVVGKYGYAEASISRITARAKVAQGTFYNYFTSRQDLFDQLLPYVGRDLLDHVKAELAGCTTEPAREERRLRAYFSFLQRNPEFYRILNEAEIFAPKAHEAHFRLIGDGYVRDLKRDWARGDLPGFEEREIEVLAYILMAARSYLSLRFAEGGRSRKPVPEWVIRAYLKFVSHGLFSAPDREYDPALGTDGRPLLDLCGEAPGGAASNGSAGRTIAKRNRPAKLRAAATDAQ
jgi:AcrR family transcriptional regulator